MKRYRYVIVCSNGNSHDLARETSFYPAMLDPFGTGGDSNQRFDLSALLNKGWRPVRETPMHGVPNVGCYSLVLLEKGVDDEPPVAKLADTMEANQ
jgi:hypothetical protein